MFDTFILQYLNKLTECQVGDFTSPQAFHAIKVKRFKSKCIKPLAEVGREFPMPVKALPADFAIQYRQFPDRTPPIIRTFFLTRKETFTQYAELFQGLFQKLRRLYLLTCGKCQKSVFHSEVCPNALTCRRKPRFGRSIVCCDTRFPVVSTSITFYRDLLNIAKPITVFVKCERDWFSYPFSILRIPFTEGDTDMIIFYRFLTRYPREGDRLEFVLGFDMRSATQFVEKSLICFMNTFQLTLDRLAWQTLPMRVCRLFQRRQMSRHRMIVGIRQSIFIALTLPQMEILMHFMHIVEQMTQVFIFRVFAYRIFIGSHWLSHITPLTPVK